MARNRLTQKILKRAIDDFALRGLQQSEIDCLLEFSDGELSRFLSAAQQRVLSVPFAYITGEVEFYGRTFKIDERCYVPNKETEQLVSVVLDYLHKKDSPCSVLDVGTGSGNIAITLKKEFPELKVSGSDVDLYTLEVARKNVERLGIDIQLYHSNYVDGISGRKPDVIIADLPWGTVDDFLHAGGIKELEYMPEVSLFHKDGHLVAQKEFFQSILRKKWSPVIFFEHGTRYKDDITKIVPEGWNADFHTFGSYMVTMLRCSE